MRTQAIVIGVGAALFAVSTLGQAPDLHKRNLAELSVLQVGLVPVSAGGGTVILEDRITRILGEGRGTAECKIAALWRERNVELWHVAAVTETEPGGLFHLSGVEFPGLGEYELAVAAFPNGEVALGERLLESRWQPQAKAISERIVLAVKVVETAAVRQRIALISVAGVGIHGREVIPAPPSADVEFAATGFAPSTRYYVGVHVPHTDRGYLYGPADLDSATGNYWLTSVPLVVPGDLRQLRLEVVAIGVDGQAAAGPVSWEAMRDHMHFSIPVEVATEAKGPPGENLRVPYVSITRIGNASFAHPAIRNGSPALVETVKNGDQVEAVTYDRLTQGSLSYVVTSYVASDQWLIQGPMLLRGEASPSDIGTGPAITFVWPKLRFELPAGAPEEGRLYRTMIVITTEKWPNRWVDTQWLASKAVDSHSEILTVRADGIPASPVSGISITRIGDEEVESQIVETSAPMVRVEIQLGKEFPPDYLVYAGVRNGSSDRWRFLQGTPSGETRVVPAIPCISAQLGAEAECDLIAIATRGPLPAVELTYSQFVDYAAITSPPVHVERSKGLFESLTDWVRPLPGTVHAKDKDTNLTTAQTSKGPEQAVPSQEVPRPSDHGAVWTAFWWLLVIVALILSEWYCQTISLVCGRAANVLRDLRGGGFAVFHSQSKLDPAQFLLGCGLFGLVLYAIRRYYIRLLAGVAHKVTGLESHECFGLALWLVIIVGSLGIIIDVAFKFWLKHENNDPKIGRLYKCIFWICLGAAAVMWTFEGGLYFSSFAKDAEGIVAPLGFIVFALIAFAETSIFFFITELSLPTLGVLSLCAAAAPFFLLELGFRAVAVGLGTFHEPWAHEDRNNNQKGSLPTGGQGRSGEE